MKLMMKGILWFGFYLLLILFPLIVGWLWHSPGVEGRAFSLQFSAACGYVAFSIMAFELALIAKVAFVSAAFGQDSLLKFHRQMGLVAALLVVLHVIFVLRNGYPFEWLYPVYDGVVQWGSLTMYAVVLLIALSLGRRRLGIPYGIWQMTHSLLANVIVILAVVHILKIGSFVGPDAMKELWAVYLLLLIGLSVRFRILKPLLIWRKPWEVVQNVQEKGDARTITLKPAGHEGFKFEPGQFAWLNTGKTPLNRDQHPISLSSCAYDEAGREIAFTIKSLGDWSGQSVPAIQPGKKMWVDGPYGVFTTDREQGPGYVFIAGGVGITPFYSTCLTFADRGDQRPVFLFYAGKDSESLTLSEQLDALQSRMDLKIIYVLQNPEPGWHGERGYITGEVLQRHLPKQFRRMQYFVCGPPPMMDSMEQILPKLGVPAELIHTERFDMV